MIDITCTFGDHFAVVLYDNNFKEYHLLMSRLDQNTRHYVLEYIERNDDATQLMKIIFDTAQKECSK